MQGTSFLAEAGVYRIELTVEARMFKQTVEVLINGESVCYEPMVFPGEYLLMPLEFDGRRFLVAVNEKRIKRELLGQIDEFTGMKNNRR